MSSTINRETYVPWKGISTSSAVPIWSRPLINGPSSISTSDGNAFKARPIKHWRKQLNPEPGLSIGNSRSSVGIPFDRPGGSVYLGVSTNCKDSCANSSKITELITNDKNLIWDKTENVSGICLACNPERNRIKSATTILDKNYYSDTKAYLKSRSQTYEQKLRTMPLSTPANRYINPTTNQPIPPSDSSDGSQVWNTGNSLNFCSVITNATTIYKPNNQQFSQQGAVSSSSRLERLKYNTITKNGSSFHNAYSSLSANFGKYHGNSDALYFIKSKEQLVCVPYRRNGKKQSICAN